MNTTAPNEYALLIHKYMPPVCIVVGTVGHSLTIIAVNGRSSKKTSFTVYLTALAIVDFLILYTLALNTWLDYAFGIKVDLSALFMCKLYHYSTFLFPELSSWLIMCLTIERTVCMYLSQKIHKMPGPRVGLIVIGSIVCFLCALNGHIIYGRDIVVRGNTTICDFVDMKYTMFYFVYWSKTHFFLYFVIPATVIIFGNSAIMFKVFRSARNMTSSTVIKRRTRQVLLITVLISIAFLVLVTPLPLMFFFAPINVTGLIETIFLMTLYLNHTINFFLYVLSGSRFREDIMAAIRGMCKKTEEIDNNIGTISSSGDW